MNEYINTVLTNLQNNLKFLRKEIAQITQQELASQSGVSKDVIWRMENNKWDGGRTAPSLTSVITLCSFYGLTVTQMLDDSIENSNRQSFLKQQYMQAHKPDERYIT